MLHPPLPRPLPALPLLALLAAPAPGRAQAAGSPPEPPGSAEPVGLDARACAAPWARELPRLVRIELGATLGDQPPGPLEVNVRCAAESVTMQVADRATATTTERRMDLSGTAPSVRGRVVALAIAGLMRELTAIARAAAIDRERVAEPERARQQTGPRAPVEQRSAEPRAAAAQRDAEPPAPIEHAEPEPPAPPEAPDAEPPPSIEPARTLQLGLLLLAANFEGSSAVVWGGGVRADYLRLAPWRIALDLQAGTYARESELGQARLVSGSLGARAGYTLAGSALALTAGLGQRLGLARASARANDEAAADATAVLGAWTAPFAYTTLELSPSGAARIALDAELGIVLLPLHGRIQHAADLDVSGSWAALSLLLAVRL